MASVVGYSARQFSRAMIMPNLSPPITTVKQALHYRQEIIDACSGLNRNFQPIMSLYLCPDTNAHEIALAAQTPSILAAKLYPAGATTHSERGVSNIKDIYPTLAAMEKTGLVLQIHGESIDPNCDVFDRENRFITESLGEIVEEFPQLKIVLEHITTVEAVAFVKESSNNIAATITPHHLRLNRNAMFDRGFRPHAFCLPVLKREHHRQALVSAAISGNPKFFLGTDSAPHPQSAKESSCGCAGIFSAHAALEFYAEVFDSAQALNRLEGFSSLFGADFYGVARNESTVTLAKSTHTIPEQLPFGEETVIPLGAGQILSWKLMET